MQFNPGTRFNQYEILSPLGKGGMGEVYLARDAKLERNVALKILPLEFTFKLDRLRRFEQEAKAVSALNHPNIITIHEIGATNNTHFITTEFIEGHTLRERLAKEKLSLTAALDIAIQTATALSAAHSAGIIHRDIKPENVMLRKDGIVKVLDFGLAKLTPLRNADFGQRNASNWNEEADTLMQSPDGNPQSPIRNPQLTDPGTVMGTAHYMSPEQARGEKVDARSDIFSLGVVLYEMVAGQRPFDGVNIFEQVAAVLDREPAPLTDALPELQRIVSKALRKDREHRYQHINDLLLDLKDLKQELEIEAKLKGREPANDVAQTVSLRPDTTEEPNDNRTTSSASIIFSELKRHQRGVAIALVAMLVLAGGVGVWLYKFIAQKSPTASSALKITRLTSTGKATRAAISPDGKYVVYAQDDGGQQSLWVTQVAASSNVQIVPPAEVRYAGITFARDGNFIYYVRRDKENPNSALWYSPVLGGNARKLLDNIIGPITLSPDGKQLAFQRHDPGLSESLLMIANVDGSEEKKLAVHKYPDNFIGGPAWSPDGKTIACGYWHRTGNAYKEIVAVRVADGFEQPITSQRWEGVGIGGEPRVAWLADNNGVLLTATDIGISQPQIWFLAWPGDEARSLTNDLNGYADLTLTANSDTMAVLRSDRVVNLWLAPNGEANQARQITTGAEREDGIRGISWTPDGKIVYSSNAGGNSHLWIMAENGAGNKQLSANTTRNFDPAVSLDGRYIVWASKGTSKVNIWRMEIDGSNVRQLTNGNAEIYPQISPDGKWVVYLGASDNWAMRKVPIDGGDSVQLTDRSATMPVFSPDGRLIVCNYLDDAIGQYKIAVIPFEGGQPTRIFDILGGASRPLRWTPDGRAIAFARTTNGVSNLWAQPLDGSPPKQLTEFKDQRIFNFAWSRDGKQLALSRGVVNSDVVLLSGFK